MRPKQRYTPSTEPQSRYATPIPYPKYASVPDAAIIFGCGITKLYSLGAEGKIRFVKLGASTVADIDHGLAYMASLPPAEIRQQGRVIEREAARAETGLTDAAAARIKAAKASQGAAAARLAKAAEREAARAEASARPSESRAASVARAAQSVGRSRQRELA